MRQTKYFLKTTKKISRDIKIASHRLLIQGSYIKESTAGRYYFLPLGMRVRDKIVKIVEEEMNKAGGQKMITPVLHPLELWQETNRTEAAGFELMIVEDRRGQKFALGGTAEEMFVDLIRKFNLSYRDLPLNLYQFSQKFRDELRARGGLLRVREFLMKDAYSFHASEECFQREYEKMKKTYLKIFQRLGLSDIIIIEADNGYIGGEYCHEFVLPSEAGESRYLVSENQKYAAHEDVATFIKEEKNSQEEEKPLTKVDAPRGKTMEDGVRFHNLPLWQQIKNVLFVDDKGRFILAVIRGDLDVNETKLQNLVKANSLRPATEEEIENLGTAAGFISPVGINKEVIIVADDSLLKIKNAYSGANEKNKDYLNINLERDYQPHKIGDIALAQAGFLSSEGKLQEGKGIEVGNTFQLGYHYSEKMKGATFIDKDGKEKLLYMGCYGIGIDRTLAAIVEKYHTDKEIIWPLSVAPFTIHLLSLNQDKEAEKIYQELKKQGWEILYDDRPLSAGEKFGDSDLIGSPLRIVVSKKTLAQESVEIKFRPEKEEKLIKINNLIPEIKKYVQKH